MTLLHLVVAATLAVPALPPTASSRGLPARGLPQGAELLYWPSGSRNAVTTVARAKDGGVHFTCNGSTSGHCDFLLYRASCATASGPCAITELRSFRLAVGGVRDDGGLPTDFRYCAGVEPPRCAADGR